MRDELLPSWFLYSVLLIFFPRLLSLLLLPHSDSILGISSTLGAVDLLDLLQRRTSTILGVSTTFSPLSLSVKN